MYWRNWFICIYIINIYYIYIIYIYILSGNCIGEIGLYALLRTIRHKAKEGKLFKVYLENTSIHDKNIKNIFQRNQPSGYYDLDVSLYYMIMIYILNKSKSYVLRRFYNYMQ